MSKQQGWLRRLKVKHCIIDDFSLFAIANLAENAERDVHHAFMAGLAVLIPVRKPGM